MSKVPDGDEPSLSESFAVVRRSVSTDLPNVTCLHRPGFTEIYSRLLSDYHNMFVMDTSRIPTLFGYTTLGEFSRARELTLEILHHAHGVMPALALLGTSAFIAVYRQSSKGKRSIMTSEHQIIIDNIFVDFRILNYNSDVAARDLPLALFK